MRRIFVDPNQTFSFAHEGVTFALRRLRSRELLEVQRLAKPLGELWEKAVEKAKEDQPETPEDDLEISVVYGEAEMDGLFEIVRIVVAGWEGEGAPTPELTVEDRGGIRRIPGSAVDLLHPSVWSTIYQKAIEENRLSEDDRGESR